ncbi:MAG: biotin transporter BioY, partial [Methanimicrococcus sp.]|nr:biotin transporter BioY [Methanimicrococcus sp.]
MSGIIDDESKDNEYNDNEYNDNEYKNNEYNDNEYKDNEYKDNSVKIKKMVFAALFAALIAVGAWIRIPLPFVPITLQTFFVLLAAVTLGRNWGPVCIIVYLLVGLIGYPVFAGGSSGLGVILGPTGGYLYSFVIVAFIVGFLS